jgi:polygalacturonase
MRNVRRLLFLLFLAASLVKPAYSKEINICDFGAKGDGVTNNTRAFQKAIDKASTTGEKIIVPPGVFLTGTIYLKTNTALEISKNGVIKGIEKQEAYPFLLAIYSTRDIRSRFKALLYAANVNNISICGEGTIDGSGEAEVFQDGIGDSENRPFTLFMVGCKNISVTGISFINSARWVQRYLNCDRVKIHGIFVYSHVNLNNDGLDIDDCKDVIISDCRIDSEDDAIVIKSEGDRGCSSIAVTNCILSSRATSFKLGTGSVGGFRDIVFSNSVVRPSEEPGLIHPHKARGGLSGIDLISTDGAVMQNIVISGISIDSVESPIFIRLANRMGKTTSTPSDRKAGSISNIQISNVVVRNAGPIASSISAFPGTYIENISLRDVFIETRGGGTNKDTSLAVPENSDRYPYNRMFKVKLPAYGFYLRHIKNITLDNVRVSAMGKEERMAIVFDDVRGATLSNVSGAGLSEQNKTIYAIDSGSIFSTTPAFLIGIESIHGQQIVPKSK